MDSAITYQCEVNGKYKLITKEIPFVDEKFVRFEDGQTVIILEAKHMNFSMTMLYIQSELLNEIMKASEEQQNKKKAKEKSQL